LRAASWGGERQARAGEAAAAWAPIQRAFARMTIVLVLAGVGIAATVFVLVPRGIGLNQWGDFARPKGKQTTGFTDEVEPGQGRSSPRRRLRSWR